MENYPYFKAQLTTAIIVLLGSVGYLRFVHDKIVDAWTADLFALSVLGYILAPIAIVAIIGVKAYVYFVHERKKKEPQQAVQTSTQ